MVSNGDVAFTYKHLVAPKWRKKNTDARIDGLDYSMSLMVIYFGTNKQYHDIAHHEIIMGKGVHTLTCPACGYQVWAASIAEACKRWNSAKIAEDTTKR